MKKVLIAVCFLSLLLISSTAKADTVTFNCIADTWVEEYNGGANHGGSNTLELGDVYYTSDGGNNINDFRRFYTAFEDITTQLSAGDTISNAYVTLYCTGFATPDEIGNYVYHLNGNTNNNTINMNRVTSHWTEGMTWDSGQPGYLNTGSWTTSQDVGSTGYVNFGCTNTVIQWLTSGGQEGFMFESDLDLNNIGEIYALFASRESTLSLRPILTVEYTPYDPGPGPEVPEPATMVLLGSLATGLFGFSGIRKRYNR